MPYKLKCPFCRKAFAWDPKQGMPDKCKLCGGKVGHDRDDDDIVTPWIRTNSKMKAVDEVYRQMEAGSITRADIAAQITGASAAEMSGLKITNLHDNQRAGDVAAVVESSPVTDLMNARPDAYGFKPEGAAYGDAVRSGPMPNRGTQISGALRNMHKN